MLGIDLPLAVARAEIVVTEPLPLMRHGGVDGNGLYGRQTLRGNLVYGGGPHEWLDPEATAPRQSTATPLLRNIAGRLAELFPKAAPARLLRSWAGIVGTRRMAGLASTACQGTQCRRRRPIERRVRPLAMSGRAIMELMMHSKCGFADRAVSSWPLRRPRPGWREAQGASAAGPQPGLT
jgi:sarcosine oxidase subunit beta